MAREAAGGGGGGQAAARRGAKRVPRKAARSGGGKRPREEKKEEVKKEEVPESYQGKFPDKEGAKGPNGLPRRKGGNPNGAVCKGFLAGDCPFATCSYSHKKPS